MQRFTARDVASATGLAVDSVHTARKRGQLRAQRSGKRWWYYLATDIAEWVKEWNPTARSRQSHHDTTRGDSTPQGADAMVTKPPPR